MGGTVHRDELGQLQRAVEEMLGALRGLIGRIDSDIAHLDEAALAITVERIGEGVRSASRRHG